MKKSYFGEALALSAALAGGDTTPTKFEVGSSFEERPAVEQKETRKGEEPLKEFILQTEVKPTFQNPEFFVYHENGEFSEQEKKLRAEQIEGIGTLFHDVGLDFYVVQKGETLDDIKQKLESHYPYLKNQKGKIRGFNIHAKDVVSGMTLPIPIESDERKISDQEFLKFAYESIEEMEDDPEYGEFIQALREQYSDEKIAISLLALAKQESGGKPIGQFELHRFEPKYQTFSYSIFHVLMMGPGEVARKELGMTPGQTYHPGNAIKLFFGYMVEKILEPNVAKRGDPDVIKKAKERFVEFFLLNKKSASMYNGKSWERTNPSYLNNIQGYFGEAQHYFGENGILVASLEDKTKTP
jgi:hypothetical protein